MNLAPHDWSTIGMFACVIGALIAGGLGGLGRDENMKWRVTTENSRVPAFFVVLFVAAAGALFFLGPKGP